MAKYLVITVSLHFLKKITYVSIVLVACFSFFSPSKAHAQVAVPVMEVPGSPLLTSTLAIELLTADIAFNTFATAYNTNQLVLKEVGPAGVPGTSLDSIGTQAAKILISQFTNSIVAWINSGFEGGPLFVTDPEKFFIGVGDRIAGSFIEGSELGFLCYPFALDIRLALNLNYSAAFEDEIGCTLTDVIDNIEGFTDDFAVGGWAGWFSMTQNSQNNPYGAYLDASAELDIRLASALGVEGIKLDWGKGLLSFQDCILSDPETQECLEYGPIKTPGTVIESQLEQTLGTNLRQLELADEFDEIIGALVNQLMYQLVTQAGGLLNS